MAKKTETPVTTRMPLTGDRRGYEVTGSLNMGRRGDQLDVREAGATVYEDELEPEMVRYLLDKGEIVDRNRPVAPSLAEKVVAFDHMVDVASQVGAVLFDGTTYRLAGDDTPHVGLVAFRKALSIEQLKAAIVAKFAR
jgi:hypothetical protein